MANLKNIRSQIKSVTSIQKVTKAMKMVAAAKLRKSQDNMEKARPYSERLKSLITDLIQDVDRALMPLLTKRDNINKTAFVIVTADRGLAGSFNTNIIKKAEKEIKQVGKENAELFCLGKKGYEHFSKRNYKINKNYTDFWTQLNYNKAINVGNDVVTAYLAKEIDCVKVIYNYFKNVGSQEVILDSLLSNKLGVIFSATIEIISEDKPHDDQSPSTTNNLFVFLTESRITFEFMANLSLGQLQPVVEPQVLHFKHVPFRTRVKFWHSGHDSPS